MIDWFIAIKWKYDTSIQHLFESSKIYCIKTCSFFSIYIELISIFGWLELETDNLHPKNIPWIYRVRHFKWAWMKTTVRSVVRWKLEKESCLWEKYVNTILWVLWTNITYKSLSYMILKKYEKILCNPKYSWDKIIFIGKGKMNWFLPFEETGVHFISTKIFHFQKSNILKNAKVERRNIIVPFEIFSLQL